MAKRIETKRYISGPFIHQEKIGNVYYDIFTRKGYIILNKDIKTYNKYLSIMFVIILLPFLLVQLFSFSILLAFVIAAALFIIILLIYKFNFIYKLTPVDNYIPSKKQRLYITLAEKLSFLRLILCTIAAFAASILLIIMAVLQNYSGVDLVLLFIVSVVLVYMSFITFASIIYKSKHK